MSRGPLTAAPDGVTSYYYNAQTKQSTYTRPTVAPPAAPAPKKKEKKEKPKAKVPVPGTEWTRITTNEGNTFYFHKESKRSEWTVPSEIADAVAALEESEAAEAKAKAEEVRLERMRERERVRAEVAEERKRKEEAKKRKAEGQEDGPAKKAKPEEEGFAAEDEEEWKKAVAAEFAVTDAKAAADAAKEEEDARLAEEEAAKKVFSASQAVKVAPEEGRALFKALLYEKNISPFSPWELALPQFVNDPRYVLLGSMKERRDAYEEYCREAGRARRLNKPVPVAVEKADPERDFRALMREEVTSTRTRFDDFRRKHKKDRRFYSFGRDDREREKAFKVHLRELGERKRADADRAEADFYELLKETRGVVSTSEWAVVKKDISGDARYDAVGSSSLRAELFANYLKKIGEEVVDETPEQAAERKLRERKEKQEASLKDRASKVRDQQAKVSEDVDKSRAGAGKEEGERLFGSLLVDVVRDHEMTWQDALPILRQDGRYAHPSLREGDKRRLFENHMARLGANKSNALSALFASASPSLDTRFDEVYAKISEDPLVVRLGLGPDTLRERYDTWAKGRDVTARAELNTLLAENSFVEFWGKMRKKTLDEAAAKIKDEDIESGDEEAEADIIALARQVDLDEIKTILRRDKRYRQFDHIPEERERWIREYLENMEGSTGTETIHKVGQ